MTRKAGILPVLSLVAAVGLAACGSDEEPSAEPETGPATLTFLTTSAAQGTATQVATQAVPEILGFFAEEQLTVKLETVDGATAAIQAMAGGSGDASNPGLDSMLAAVSKGVPVQVYGGLVINWPWRMAVPSDSPITTPADFKGKSVGIISISSGSNFFARAWLKENGLDPEKDVKLVPVGTGPSALAALESGQVDILALNTEPYASYEQSGRTFRYFDNPAIFNGVQSLSLAARDKTIAERGDVLARHARAMYKGLLFSAVNPEAAIRIKWRYWPETAPKDENDPEKGLKAQVAALTAWLNTALPQPIPDVDPSTWAKDYRWGEISDAQWEATQNYLVSAGLVDKKVDLDKIWNNALIDEANDWDRDAVIERAKNWKP